MQWRNEKEQKVNVRQNITQKTTDWSIRSPVKTGVNTIDLKEWAVLAGLVISVV